MLHVSHPSPGLLRSLTISIFGVANNVSATYNTTIMYVAVHQWCGTVMCHSITYAYKTYRRELYTGGLLIVSCPHPDHSSPHCLKSFKVDYSIAAINHMGLCFDAEKTDVSYNTESVSILLSNSSIFGTITIKVTCHIPRAAHRGGNWGILPRASA